MGSGMAAIDIKAIGVFHALSPEYRFFSAGVMLRSSARSATKSRADMGLRWGSASLIRMLSPSVVGLSHLLGIAFVSPQFRNLSRLSGPPLLLVIRLARASSLAVILVCSSKFNLKISLGLLDQSAAGEHSRLGCGH